MEFLIISLSVSSTGIQNTCHRMWSNNSDWKNVLTTTKLNISFVYTPEFPRITLTSFYLQNTDYIF